MNNGVYWLPLSNLLLCILYLILCTHITPTYALVIKRGSLGVTRIK